MCVFACILYIVWPSCAEPNVNISRKVDLLSNSPSNSLCVCLCSNLFFSCSSFVPDHSVLFLHKPWCSVRTFLSTCKGRQPRCNCNWEIVYRILQSIWWGWMGGGKSVTYIIILIWVRPNCILRTHIYSYTCCGDASRDLYLLIISNIHNLVCTSPTLNSIKFWWRLTLCWR